MRPHYQCDRNAIQRQAGISLVEILVASVVLGLTVSAVAAMLTNSDIFRSANDHNRQARVISQEELEDPVHHYLNYDNVQTDGRTIALDTAEAWPRTPANDNWTISPTWPLEDSVVVPARGTLPRVAIHYKTITSVVGWNESGQSRSLKLAKRITKVP